MQKAIPRSLLIFYILVFYVLLQFAWWFYLLYDLNSQVYTLKEQLAATNDPEFFTHGFKDKLQQKRLMVVGEGIVFLLLLTLGILQTRKSYRRETNAANQQKNFLLSVTHELKSPVASIRLFLETIGKRELSKEKQTELVHRAVEESVRLDQLIENILVAARIDNHSYQLVPEKINLSLLIKNFAERFNSHGHHTILTDISQNIYVNGDEMAVNSILINTVENAVKYSQAGEPVNVSLIKENQNAVIRIADRGIGINDDDKQRIFEKFFRSGNEETRKTKGTGLGLYIVNYLVKKHNGNISVKDNHPTGSVFEIRLKSIENV